MSSTSSTNEVNTAYGVSTSNTQASTASTQVSTANLSDDTVYAFLASQPNGSQLVHEDLEQIHKDDLEEIDLKWQLALLSIRTRKSAEFNKSEFNLAAYKRGLASVEEQLIFYKKNEVLFCEQLVVLKRDISYKDSEISVLKSELDKLKQDKESNQLKIENFDNASKRLFSPSTIDFSNSGLEEFQQPEFEGYGPKISNSVSEDISNEVMKSPDAPLVEELVSNDKLEKKIVFPTVAKINFVKQQQQQEKPVRKPVKYAKMYISQTPRGNQRNWNNQKSQQLGSDFVIYNKACFVCGSFDHMQANCNYHQKERMVSGNNYTRVNHNYAAQKAHPSTQRNMAPRAVLMKTGLRPLNTARPVNTAHPKTTVYSARPMSHFSKSAQSTIKRPKAVNTARPNSTVVNVVRVNQGHPQKEDQGYVDSGCSRHMTGNMSYLSDFKEFDGGYVTFGGGAKGGKITGKGTLKTGKLDFEDVYFVKELQFNLFSVSQMCDKKNSVLFTDTGCFVLSPDFKLADESQVLLKVPRKNNMYSVDMKNIVPKESLTCLVAKATLDESMLWHRRLGHVNFKTINKLVKENLVRGLPSKHFENDQTCVACLKGKQHKASCKSKIQNSITQPLFMLHMDLFGPTFVSSLMNKKYCLVVTDDYSRFTWVFFLASKDETSGILKSFITEIENLVDKKDSISELRATIDTIKYIITEAYVRSKLQLTDASGISMLPNTEIFEGMGNMGYPVDGPADQAEDQPSSSEPLPSTSHPTPVVEPTHVPEPTTHPSETWKNISKRRNVVLTTSEDEEPEDQGRIFKDIDDDPLVSFVTTHYKPSAKLEANAELAKSVIAKDMSEEDFAKRMGLTGNKKGNTLQMKGQKAKEKEKEKEPVKKMGKRRKQIARKGLHTAKDEAEKDEASEEDDSSSGTNVPINHVLSVMKRYGTKGLPDDYEEGVLENLKTMFDATLSTDLRLEISSEDEDNELPNLDHQDNPSSPRPPPKPPDVKKCLEPEAVTNEVRIRQKSQENRQKRANTDTRTEECARAGSQSQEKSTLSQLWSTFSQNWSNPGQQKSTTRRQRPKVTNLVPQGDLDNSRDFQQDGKVKLVKSSTLIGSLMPRELKEAQGLMKFTLNLLSEVAQAVTSRIATLAIRVCTNLIQRPTIMI
ncbi:putative ribonuclease H-like domain-containing protein [Tanacetum coccineum]